MGFGLNLIRLRQSRGIGRKELAEMLGIPYTTLRNYETETREPGHKILMQLAEIFSVSVDSLIGFTQKEKTALISDAERRHIQKYRTLDGYGKEMVDAALSIEYKRCAALREDHENENDNLLYIPYPYSQVAASEGSGAFLDDGAGNERELPVKLNSSTRKADAALKVVGRSMEPDIHDGDLVLVRRQPEVEIGEIGIFIIDGRGYIKRRGEGGVLESLNSSIPDVQIQELQSCTCWGKYIDVLKPEWIAGRPL